MARSVADAAAILSVIAGSDSKDDSSVSVEVPNYLEQMTKGISSLKVGIDYEFALGSSDSETKAMLLRTIELIKSLGAEIIEIDMPDTTQAAISWSPMCAVETAIVHEETYLKFKEYYGPSFSKFIEMGQQLLATDYQKLMNYRHKFTKQINQVFEKVDLLILPVSAYAASLTNLSEKFSEDKELFKGIVRYTSPFNLTGHPTITLPGGFTQNGAPIGFQFVANYFAEELLIRAGWEVQKNTKWHKIHPDF